MVVTGTGRCYGRLFKMSSSSQFLFFILFGFSLVRKVREMRRLPAVH